jgi:hypothetical protein
VLADGELIATKKPGLIARLFGTGWPEPEAVVAAIEALGKHKP